MTPDFSRAWAGRPGKQHRAEGAGGSGLCGEGEGEHPKMQKVQKDQQAGEKQDAHSSQIDLLSPFPPPSFSAPLLLTLHLSTTATHTALSPPLYPSSPRGR